MIQQGINSAQLAPQSIAKADAAICRGIGREVERAVKIANACQMWKGSGPVTSAQHLACAEQTDRWQHLSYDCERTLRVAIGATESYEAAAVLIEKAAGLR
jgi:hypothetical protein